MALGALTLSVTSGVQGRPFQATIIGLTTGRVEVLTDGSPGFSTVNGKVMSSGLPYPVSTVVLREYEPGVGQGFRDSRIEITAATREALRAQAIASLGVGRSLGREPRVAGMMQPDGSLAYTLRVEDDLGATVSHTPSGTPTPTPTPSLGTLALFGPLTNGTASSGTIIGATTGSTITSNVTGLVVNSGARTYAFDGTATAATIANGLVETLAGATGSPRSSAVTVVAAAGYTFANSEAQTFVGRMTTTPADSYKAAYDQLFGRLKAGRLNGSNLLAAFDVFYVRAAPSQQAALLNLMGTTYTSTLSASPPPFRPGYGFTTNGQGSYVEWGGWMPSLGVQYQRNSACMGLWARRPEGLRNTSGSVANDGGPALGTQGNSTAITPSSVGGMKYRINSGTTTNGGAVADGSGFFCIVRPDASTQRAYRNAVQQGSDAAVVSTAASATVIREGCANNATITTAYSENQLPFSWAGRALTAAEIADLNDALSEYLTAIGWLPLLTFINSGGDAAIQAQAIQLPAITNKVYLPDAVPTIVAGKGFTCTGAVRDPRDGTYWVSAFGRNVQGDTSSTPQPYIVHLAADRVTLLGVINLVAVGMPANLIQGLAYDTTDNTLWVASGSIYHVAADTGATGLIGSPLAFSVNALVYDSLRDKLFTGTSYINKDGTTTNLPSLGTYVPGNYVDQACYRADLDAFLVTGGPNGQNGTIARVGWGQNYDAVRMMAFYQTTGGASAIEGITCDPTTKVATVFNDWWYHGSSGGQANGSALVQLPI